jgi:hypothetical protein
VARLAYSFLVARGYECYGSMSTVGTDAVPKNSPERFTTMSSVSSNDLSRNQSEADLRCNGLMSFTAALNRHYFTVSIAFPSNTSVLPTAHSIRWAEQIMEEIDRRHPGKPAQQWAEGLWARTSHSPLARRAAALDKDSAKTAQSNSLRSISSRCKSGR